MFDDLSLRAFGKINLSLDILDRAPNGMHTLSTIMQSVDVYDTITVSTDCDGIVVKCGDEIPCDETNTAYKAAAAFFDYAEIAERNAEIKIKKHIPVSAGLGGGSADAAAVIRALDTLYKTHFEDDDLCAIAEKVGADVPFCINGGTQLCEGYGAILSHLPPIDDCCFLLIKDDEKVSTGEMYAKFDALDDTDHPDMAQIIDNICEADLYGAADLLGNAFSPLWGEKYGMICTDLIDRGAVCATLTGSGPTVFGIFENEDDARRAKAELDDKYAQVIYCEPHGCGVEEK